MRFEDCDLCLSCSRGEHTACDRSICACWCRGTRQRGCNGGPNGTGGCGKPATVVCTADDGLQWYACDERAHREGGKTMPMAAWWKLLDEGA